VIIRFNTPTRAATINDEKGGKKGKLFKIMKTSEILTWIREFLLCNDSIESKESKELIFVK
jgi:hypothetical protein